MQAWNKAADSKKGVEQQVVCLADVLTQLLQLQDQSHSARSMTTRHEQMLFATKASRQLDLALAALRALQSSTCKPHGRTPSSKYR